MSSNQTTIQDVANSIRNKRQQNVDLLEYNIKQITQLEEQLLDCKDNSPPTVDVGLSTQSDGRVKAVIQTTELTPRITQMMNHSAYDSMSNQYTSDGDEYYRVTLKMSSTGEDENIHN